MYRIRLVIAAALVLLLAGCAEPAPAPGPPPSPAPTAAPEQEGYAHNQPEWARPVLDGGALFQGLNLDGAGEADDEIYAVRYRWGEGFDGAVVLTVRLGTGETLTQIYPGDRLYTLQTAPLFSEDKDAVILELTDPRNNWGGTSLRLLEVCPAGSDPAPYIQERLSTPADSIAGEQGAELLDTSRIVIGTEPVPIEGTELWGLRVPCSDPNDQWGEYARTVYWSESGWKALDK